MNLVKNESENLKFEESKKVEKVEKVIDEIPEDFLVTLHKPQCQGFELCQIYKLTIKYDGSVLEKENERNSESKINVR